MRDPDEATDGPPDPQLDPTRSPGFGSTVESLEDIEVGRDDVTIGDATPSDLTAADTAPVAEETVDSLLETVEAGDAPDRRRAALALGERWASKRVRTALATAARTDPDGDVRQFALEALGALEAENLPAVARSALGDESPWVRAEAVVTLDGHDRAGHADLIEECLDDEHHAVRRNAVVSLAKHRGEAFLQTLLDFVDDDSERVREWVAECLGVSDDEPAREALEELTADDSDIVAEAAATALDDETDRRELFTESTAPTDYARPDTPPNLYR